MSDSAKSRDSPSKVKIKNRVKSIIVDKSRLEIVLEYLNSYTALDNLIIEEW